MARVSNLIGLNGNPVTNQFVISDADCTTFQSYDTTIAMVHNSGNVTLFPMWDCSRTTTKYTCKFLRDYTSIKADCKADIVKAIKTGKVKAI